MADDHRPSLCPLPFFFLFSWDISEPRKRRNGELQREANGDKYTQIVEQKSKVTTNGSLSGKRYYTAQRLDWSALTARRAPSSSRTLFLPSLDNIPVLTCDDFNLRGRDVLVRFHLERRIFHQERPHVIA